MEDNHKAKNVERWANVRLMEEEHRALDAIQNRLQTTRSRLLRKVIRELIGMGPDLLPQEWMVFDPTSESCRRVSSVGKKDCPQPPLSGGLP